MNTSPMISVIIPYFNRARTIERALASVAAQRPSRDALFAPGGRGAAEPGNAARESQAASNPTQAAPFIEDIEVIIVDDGSDPDQAAALRRIVASFAGTFRVRVYRQGRKGVAGARNTALRVARGDVVAFLDSDDAWMPDKLAIQLAMMARGIDFAAGGVEYRNARGERLKTTTPEKAPAFERMAMENVFATSTAMLRRRCLEALRPWFRGELRVAEDWELWLRIATRHRVAVAGEVVASYHVSRDSLQRSLDPEDTARDYAAVMKLWLLDPIAGPRLHAIWPLARKNLIYLAAYEAMPTRPFRARLSALRCLATRPWRFRAARAVALLLLPRVLFAWLRRLQS